MPINVRKLCKYCADDETGQSSGECQKWMNDAFENIVTDYYSDNYEKESQSSQFKDQSSIYVLTRNFPGFFAYNHRQRGYAKKVYGLFPVV